MVVKKRYWMCKYVESEGFLQEFYARNDFSFDESTKSYPATNKL